MKRLILLCLLAWPAFADPLSDEKTRQVLAEGDIYQTRSETYKLADFCPEDTDFICGETRIEYLDIRYEGELLKCRVDWTLYDSETDPETRRFWRKADERCDG